jgi:hypothetical protein
MEKYTSCWLAQEDHASATNHQHAPNTVAEMSESDDESNVDDEVLLFTSRMTMDPPADDLEVRAHLEYAELLCHGSEKVCAISDGGGRARLRSYWPQCLCDRRNRPSRDSGGLQFQQHSIQAHSDR